MKQLVEVSAQPTDEYDEAGRLAAVRRYGRLDSPFDGSFDRITAMAARLLRTPLAMVSVVEESTVWFKSVHGADLKEVNRAPGLCPSAILGSEPLVVPDIADDPRTVGNPLVESMNLRFYAGVPLRCVEGHNLGALCVIDFVPREATASDVAILEDLAGVAMDMIELGRLARQTIELEAGLRSRAEAVAAALQESLIPPTLPPVEGVSVLSRYHVAQRDVVGGDFFDVVPCPWGTALIVGDACGKGPMAAAAAGTARWTLRTLLASESDPGAAMTSLNALLHRSQREVGSYVTAVAATIRRVWGQTELAVAVGGHPHPLVMRAHGEVHPIGATGPLIGWYPDCAYGRASTVLGPGDTVVIYTDGLLEGLGGPARNEFDPLTKILEPLCGRPLEEIADRLDSVVGPHHRDDAAFLVARPT